MSTRKEYQRFLNKFDLEGFWRKKACGISLEKRFYGTEERCQRKRVMSLESTRLCMKKIS